MNFIHECIRSNPEITEAQIFKKVIKLLKYVNEGIVSEKTFFEIVNLEELRRILLELPLNTIPKYEKALATRFSGLLSKNRNVVKTAEKTVKDLGTPANRIKAAQPKLTREKTQFLNPSQRSAMDVKRKEWQLRKAELASKAKPVYH